MFRKHPDIFAAALIAFFIAITFAFFPEDGAYYDALSRGLAGGNHSGIVAHLYLAILTMAWKTGGSLLVHVTVMVLSFFVILLTILGILFVFHCVGKKLSPHSARLMPAAAWLFIILMAVITVRPIIRNWSTFGTDHRLLAPLDLLEYAKHQKAKTVYFNPYTSRYITALHPEWLPPREEPSWKLAAGDPALWRSLDRNRRFDLVLLSGPIVEFQPLMDHLLASPDWQLVYFDNGGFAFARQREKKATAPLAEDLEERFSSSKAKATALAQAAIQSAALQDYETANSLLRKAESFDKECNEVFVARAMIDLQRKNWSAAAHHADEALAKNPTLLSALQIKVQAEMENRDYQEAFFVSLRIIDLYPEDFYSLLLHARIANAVHAYESEAMALKKVIAIAKNNNLSTGVYQVFLGQSYAKQGLSRQSIEEFEAANKDPSLSESQKKQIKDTLSTIELHSGRNQKN